MSRWIRLYVDVPDNAKVQLLPAETFKFWINLLCVADEDDGLVPPAQCLAWKFRVTESRADDMLRELVTAGLVDKYTDGLKVHDWKERQYKQDSSTPRVRLFRKRKGNAEKRDETVSETVSETRETVSASVSVSVSDSVSDSTSDTEKASTRARAPKPQKEDPVEQIQYWLKQYGQHMGVEIAPDAAVCFRLARSMFNAGKNLDDFEEILRQLIEQKQKPKSIGWLITVIEAKLGGGINAA